MQLLEFLSRNKAEFFTLLGEHLMLVGVSIGVALAVGIPLGVILTRRPQLSPPILGLANIFQTIPSLALFGFLIPIPFIGGIGARTAIVALVLYALLPIIRNTYAGIQGVDPAVREAGRGMGMTDRQLLFMVEIPLAFGVILAGVRVATVIGVGIATIAAAIGAGGLGVFIFRGVATVNNTLILAGALPAALMALAVDFLLGRLERRYAPGGAGLAQTRPA
ncbi:MAG: ABC transporter permease [Gemmatimonadetes bacterium]|uniref:ABC transporter permease n=1 Tax=Candidatus Kutchimonas denitrificans TaxID=3056748 RepID=A0AAE5CCY4_9BACT|nr:ABC transporter permease [Gemmatimonadota bacterium]NIR74819.1 ABC transporter permease [Candidatus Kutchimonas denitrificans]NIR99930.1 ABC transporter permease [Gemmatimonadota bacterium]NIT65514.1 ABC transporter permease [Gemmatimonadota bacterium]NIU52484.1 ABC transporter permease subunit [Gemmatimonadota bacterium]